MNDPIDLVQLREALLEAPESDVTRYVAVVGSLSLLAIVLWLVRKRTLREEYTPIWVAVALVITVVGLRMDVLRAVTRALGAWAPSSTLFFLGEGFLILICLNYAVRLSRHGAQLRSLAQESALLRARLDELEGGRGSE